MKIPERLNMDVADALRARAKVLDDDVDAFDRVSAAEATAGAPQNVEVTRRFAEIRADFVERAELLRELADAIEDEDFDDGYDGPTDRLSQADRAYRRAEQGHGE